MESLRAIANVIGRGLWWCFAVLAMLGVLAVVLGILGVLPDDSMKSSGTKPAAAFCDSHTCVGDFYNESGYIVECGDGTWSHAGGLSGACSHHQGSTGRTP